MQITTVGLDLAKSIFQVHGVDATGQVVEVTSLPGRHGGLRHVALLGARADRARP
jgi:hypothetical protein